MANPKLKPNQFLLPFGAMITELPLLFQTKMVQANLDGRKTQTRRIKGLDIINEYSGEFTLDRMQVYPDGLLRAVFDCEGELGSIKSPYGKPGDLLWVRETWVRRVDFFGDEWVDFKATRKCEVEWDEIDEDPWGNKVNIRKSPKWKPSIHMPKAASRIWVMVEEVRVERLQEISEEDAKAEGLCERNNPNISEFNLIINKGKTLCTGDYLFVWRSLWVSINGADSWNSNPWVWVVKYRILSKTGRPSNEIIEKNYLEVTNPPRVAEPLEGSIKPDKPKP